MALEFEAFHDGVEGNYGMVYTKYAYCMYYEDESTKALSSN